MSAWIVSKTHIDLLVSAMFRYEVIKEPFTPDEVGKILWRENHRSINYRYQEKHRTPAYRHDDAARCTSYETRLGTVRELVHHPHLLYKQLCCYNYQSCEHPGYPTSKAKCYLDALDAAICAGVGKTSDEMHNAPEWEQQPWGID